MRFIQGGSVFIPKHRVEQICEVFERCSKESIQKGYVGSDEKIFDFVYLEDQKNYNLIKCGWREYFDIFI